MSATKKLTVSTYIRPSAKISYSATIPAVESRVTRTVVRNTAHLDAALLNIKKRYEDEARHVQTNYEVDCDNQLTLLKTIEELEILLDEERLRSADLENKLNVTIVDLERERRLRLDAEHEITLLKEDLRRAELVISEQDAKIVRLSKDVTCLDAENQDLRAEIHRITDLYNVELAAFEDKYLRDITDLNGEIQRLKNSLELQRNDYENRLRDLDRDWSVRCSRLEDGLKDKDRIIVDLENEIRRLKDTIAQQKIAFEDDLRRQLAIVREEELHRYTLSLKSLEAKLHQVEAERDILIRKNQDLVRELSIKERQLHDLRLQFETEVARLRAEINALKDQVNALTMANDRLKGELAAKDGIIARLEGEIANLEREMARLKDIHAQEITRLVNDHNADVRRFEQAERLLKARIDELELLVRTLEAENLKLKTDIERIKQHVVGNVNRTIFDTFGDYEKSQVITVVKPIF